MPASAPPAAAIAAPSTTPGRWALALLTAVNLLNYVDRFVVAALAESLKGALALADAQLGALATAFIVVYTFASPVFGAYGDRARRPRLLAIGVALWSVATALGAAAWGWLSLLAARAAVGVGEAAYGTLAPGFLADLFPLTRRGRTMAVFFVAIPAGSALGYVLGGLVDHALGWRAAFLVAGVPGLVLALLVARLPDPPRGAQEPGASPAEPAHGAAGRGGAAAAATGLRLLHNAPYAFTVLGYAAYTFAVGGMAFWMPAFLERTRGLTRAAATVQFGAIVVVTGVAGTFAGGWLGDAWLRRSRQAYLWLSGLATLAAAPLAWAFFAGLPRALDLPVLCVAQLLLFASTGPVNTAIVNAVAPGERAAAMALSIFSIHILGDVPSPPLIGWLSDRSSLAEAVRLIPVAILVAGALWTYEAWRGGRAGAPAAGPPARSRA